MERIVVITKLTMKLITKRKSRKDNYNNLFPVVSCHRIPEILIIIE